MLFGDLAKLEGGEHDPAVWLQRAARNPAALPRLFVSCGREDDLYPLNRAFLDACRSLGIPVEYHEEDGKHDWFFWDARSSGSWRPSWGRCRVWGLSDRPLEALALMRVRSTAGTADFR